MPRSRANRLMVGDRVRAKVRTAFGWKGTGTVAHIIGGSVTVVKEDGCHEALFCRHELARIRPKREPR
jgi:hypothetical protein